MRRRTILRALGSGFIATGVAGCLGGSGGSPGTSRPTTSSTGGTPKTVFPTVGTQTGTTGTGNRPSGAGGTPNSATTVDMVGTSFDPVRATVDPGTTVTWRNRSGTEQDLDHEVKAAQFTDGAASWRFDQPVAAGETVSHTFDQPGVYEYFCPIHGKSNMCGSVLVGDVSLASGALPCEGSGSGGGSGGGGGGGGGNGYY